MRVLAFAGTRADLFPLGPVLVALAATSSIDLHVATAIGFAPGTAASRLAEAGLADAAFTHHDLGCYLDAASPSQQTDLGPLLAAALGKLVEEIQPDALVVLGDRWELLYVVPVAVIHGVRVIHLHGGEVTEGALDERVRHATTKLADQHCVSTAGAAQRVSQLGEQTQRIHVTGAPGLDRFRDVVPLTEQEFESTFGTVMRRPIALVTYHPETASATSPPGESARAVFREAIDAAGTTIITYPGFDVGRDDIIKEIRALENESRDGVVVVESLGPLYPRVMATIDVLIGNSSSGILEAATFGVPVVNIGERQRGREHGVNVLHSTSAAPDIRASIGRVLATKFRRTCDGMTNPYGDSSAAPRILDVIMKSGQTPLTKTFVDCGPGKLGT